MWNNFNNHPNHSGNRPQGPNGGYRPRGNRGCWGPNQWSNHNMHHLQQPPPFHPHSFPPPQLQQPHFSNGNAPQFAAFSTDAFQSPPPFIHGGIGYERAIPPAYRLHTSRGRDCDKGSHFSNQPPPFNQPKRFLSPPRTPMPPQRPPSPLPGSEEYRQRNIQHTSELIKRQLLGDDSVVDTTLNVSTDVGMVEGGVPSVFQRDAVMQQPRPQLQREPPNERENKKKEKTKTRTNRLNSESSNRPFDVHEIHQQIVRHISNLSHNKKANIVNQVGNTAGYDVAILQMQKQKRLELSRALRDLCSSNIPIDPDSDVLNDIIPDIGIKLEDLPHNVIVQLSSLNAEHQWGNIPDEFEYKQDITDGSEQQFRSDSATASPPLEDVHIRRRSSCYIDSSIVDPELCFKQAEQLISGFDDDTSAYITSTGVLYDNGIISELSQKTDELPSVGFNKEIPLFYAQVSEKHEGDRSIEQIPELRSCGHSALPNTGIFSVQISDIRDGLPCSNIKCNFGPPEQHSVGKVACNELPSVSKDTDIISEFEEVPNILPIINNISIATESSEVIEDLSAIQLPLDVLSVAPPSEQNPKQKEDSSKSVPVIEPNSNLLPHCFTLNQQLSKSVAAPKSKISIVLEKSPKLPPNIFHDESLRKLTKNSVIHCERIFKKLCNDVSKSKNSISGSLLPSVNRSAESSIVSYNNFKKIPTIQNKRSIDYNTKYVPEQGIELKVELSSETTDHIITEPKPLHSGHSSLLNAISCAKINNNIEKVEPFDQFNSNFGKSSSIEKNSASSVPKTVVTPLVDPDKLVKPRLNSDKIADKSQRKIKPLLRRNSVPDSKESQSLLEVVRFQSDEKLENTETVNIGFSKSKLTSERIRLKRDRKIETTVEADHPPQPHKSDENSFNEDSYVKSNRKSEAEIIEASKLCRPEIKWDQKLLKEDSIIRIDRKNEETSVITKPSSSDNKLDKSGSMKEDFSLNIRRKGKKGVDLYERAKPKPRKSDKSKSIKEGREILDKVRTTISAKLRTPKKRLLKSNCKALDNQQFNRQRLYEYINSLPSLNSKVISISQDLSSKTNVIHEEAQELNRSPVLSFNEISRNPENPNYCSIKNVLLFNDDGHEEGEILQIPDRKAIVRQREKRFDEVEVLPDITFDHFSSDADLASEFAASSNEGRLSPMSRRIASALMNPIADLESHNINLSNADQPQRATVVKFSDLKNLKNNMSHAVLQDSAAVSLREVNPNGSYLDSINHRSDYKRVDEHVASSSLNGNNCVNCIHCREKKMREENRKAKKRDQVAQKIKLRRQKLCENSTSVAINIDIPEQIAPLVLENSSRKAWRSPAERKMMPEQEQLSAPSVKTEKKFVYEMEDEQLDYDETLNDTTEEEKTESVTGSDLRVIPLIEIKEEVDPDEEVVSSNVLEQIEVFNNSMNRILENDKSDEETSSNNVLDNDIPVSIQGIEKVSEDIIKDNISNCAEIITSNRSINELSTDTGHHILSAAIDVNPSDYNVWNSHEISTTTANDCPILFHSAKSSLEDKKPLRVNKVVVLENISLSQISSRNLDTVRQIMNASFVLPEALLSGAQIVDISDRNIVQDANTSLHQTILSKEIVNEKSDELETASLLTEKSANQEVKNAVDTNEELSYDGNNSFTTEFKLKEEESSKQDGHSTKSSSSSYKHSSSHSSHTKKKSSDSTSADKHASSNSPNKRNDNSFKASDKGMQYDKDISSRSRSRSSDPSKSSRDNSASLEPDKRNTSSSRSSHKSSKEFKSESLKVDSSKNKSKYKKDDDKISQSKGKSYRSSRSHSSSSHSKPDVCKRDVTRTSIMIQTDETKHSNTYTQTDVRKTLSASKHVQVGSVKTLNKSVETDPKPLMLTVGIQTDDIEIENMLPNSHKGKSKKNVLAQMRDIDREIERLLKLKSDLYRKADIYSDESEDGTNKDVKELKADSSDVHKKSRRRAAKRKGDPVKDAVKVKTRRLRSQVHVRDEEDDNNSLKDMLESTLRELVDPISKENEDAIKHNTRSKGHKNKLLSDIDKKIDDSNSIRHILEGIEPVEESDITKEELNPTHSSASSQIMLREVTVEQITQEEITVPPAIKQKDITLRFHNETNTRQRKFKSLAETLKEIDDSTFAKDILESSLQKVVDPICKDGAVPKVTRKTKSRRLETQRFSDKGMCKDISTKDAIENNPKLKVDDKRSKSAEASVKEDMHTIAENGQQMGVIKAIGNATQVSVEVCLQSKLNSDSNKPEVLEAITDSLIMGSSADPSKEIMQIEAEITKSEEISRESEADNNTVEIILDDDGRQQMQTSAIEKTADLTNERIKISNHKTISNDDKVKAVVKNSCLTKDIWQYTAQDIIINQPIENSKNHGLVDRLEENQMPESNTPKEILTTSEAQVRPNSIIEIDMLTPSPSGESCAQTNDVQPFAECVNISKLTRSKRLSARRNNELQNAKHRLDSEDIITQSRMARRIAHKNAEAVKLVEQTRLLRIRRKPVQKLQNLQQNVVENANEVSISSDLNKDSQVEVVNELQASAVIVEHNLPNNEYLNHQTSDDCEELIIISNKGNDKLVVEANVNVNQRLIEKEQHKRATIICELETDNQALEGDVVVVNEAVETELDVQNASAVNAEVPDGSDIQKAKTDSEKIPTVNKRRKRNVLKSATKRTRQLTNSITSITETLETAVVTKRPVRRRDRRRRYDNTTTIDNPSSAIGRNNTALLSNIITNSNELPQQTDDIFATDVQAVDVGPANLPVHSSNVDKVADRERRSASITSLCPSDGLENLMEVVYEEPITLSEDSVPAYRGPKRKRQRKSRFRSDSSARRFSLSLTETIDNVARNISVDTDHLEEVQVTKECIIPNTSNESVELKDSVVYVVRYSLSDLLTMKANLLKFPINDTLDIEDVGTPNVHVTSDLLTSHLDIKCEPRSVESNHSDHDPVDEEQPPSIEDSRLTVSYLNEDAHATIEMPDLQEFTGTCHEPKDGKIGFAGLDLDMLEDMTTDIVHDYESQMGAYTTESSNIRIEVVSDEPSTIIDRETFGGCVGPIIAVKAIESYILGSSDRGTLYIYDLPTSKLLCALDIATKALTALCVVRSSRLLSNSKSGSAEQLLYTGALDRTVAVVDYKNGIVKKYIDCDEPVQCMEYNWGYVFMGTYNGCLRRLNTKTHQIEDSVSIANSTVLQLKASREGARRVILVATRNQAVSVRDAMTGLLLRTMDTTLNPTVYTLLCNQSLVYCGTSKHDVLIYSFQDGQLIHKLEESNGSGVVCLASYKKLLFTGCYNGNIYAYKLPSNLYIGVIPGPGGLLLSMDILDDKIAVSTRLNFKSIAIPNSILAHIAS